MILRTRLFTSTHSRKQRLRRCLVICVNDWSSKLKLKVQCASFAPIPSQAENPANNVRFWRYAELCKEYDIPTSRLEWLHEQFRSFLPEGVVDTYPVDAAALSKVFVKLSFVPFVYH